jgi:hemolysin type calcium-binding protein
MLGLRTLGTAGALALFALAAGAGSAGADSSVACSFSVPLHYTPGLAATQAAGDFHSSNGEADCVGQVRDEIVGIGTVTMTGGWAAHQLDCAGGTGDGLLQLRFPKLLGWFSRESQRLDGRFAFRRTTQDWTAQGTADDSDGRRWNLSLSGVERATSGDCLSSPMTESTLAGQLLVAGGGAVVTDPSAQQTSGDEAPPAPPRCAKRHVGTNRRDRLTGTSDGDFLSGLAGNDSIAGEAGDDCLFGDSGADSVSGGPGDDAITGGRGSDRIDAGAGADVIAAADGTRDVVNCGAGSDRVRADRRDVLRGCEHRSIH